MKKKLILFIGMLILCELNLFAGNADKEAQAVRIFTELKIDGKLSEIEWKEAKSSGDFIEKNPIENSIPQVKTELRFLYNSKYLYIGVRVFRKNIDDIQAHISGRDNPGNAERIVITLDTYNDNKTAYSFLLSATGVRADYYHHKDSEYARDYNYNPVWTGKSNIDSLGWTAEFSIPFNQLRFNNRDIQTWGLNANLFLPKTGQDIYWQMIPKNETGWSSRFGKLKGIKGIKQSKRIEFLPYLTGGMNFDAREDDDNPFYQPTTNSSNIGLDFKMGFGPNITLDATINPDFGQIEADPANLNLTEFETYYAEKRPFFIEGNKLFSNTGIDYYYSRRIGASSSYSPHADYIDRPKQTTIIGASKVTGRTITGMSYGIMSCLTDSETAKYYLSETDTTMTTAILPTTLFNVIRFSQETDEDGSNFGIILTSTNRLFEEETILNDFYNRAAYSGGLDWNLYTKEKKYNLSGNIGLSHLQGTQERMIGVQRSVAQMFQRPDANILSVDSNITQLTGYVGKLELEKETGEHWLWELGLYTETPKFNINDIGRIGHADVAEYYGELVYRDNAPGKYFLNYRFTLMTLNKYNFNFDRMRTFFEINSNITFLNQSKLYLEYQYNLSGLSATQTWGGIMTGVAPNHFNIIHFESDWTKIYNYSASIVSRIDYIGKRDIKFRSKYEINYMRWMFSSSLDYNYDVNPRQYIKSIERLDKDITYGQRYIFGKLNRNTISTTFRINYSFSPNITLETYVEPYYSTGEYISFGEIDKSKSYDWIEYGVDGNSQIDIDKNGDMIINVNNEGFSLRNRDFAYTSFIASAVLKWEYKQGCLFYLVAHIDKKQYDDGSSKFDVLTLADALKIRGMSSVALKMTYWFPVD